MTEQQLAMIPVASIRPNDVALRTVDKESEAYLGLVDSIREKGVMNAISVHESKDKETGVPIYVIIDGLHRFTAAVDAGLEKIPASILAVEGDNDVLERQIVGNVHKVDTLKMEYTKQLRRLFMANPTLTINELAAKLGKSAEWLSERLSLLKLIAQAQEKVNSDEISLNSAYSLAKLPQDEQINFLERAMTLDAAEFIGQVNERLRQIRASRLAGGDTPDEEFAPTQHLQKMSVIKEAVLNPDFAIRLVEAEGANDAVAGVRAALNWVLHTDKASVTEAKAKFEARLAERKEAKAKRDEERKQKKLAAAKAAFDAAQAEAAAAK